MYNERFFSLKHKDYVEGKKNKYGCHGNQDCYLSPFHMEKTTLWHWKSNSFIWNKYVIYLLSNDGNLDLYNVKLPTDWMVK